MSEQFEVSAVLKAYDETSSVVKKVALSYDVLKNHGVSAFDTLMREAKVYERAVKKAADSSASAFEKTKNSMKSGIGSAVDGLKSAVVGSAVAIGAAAAGGVALGFKTLNDIEGFKIQFETAFKGDTKKAKEHMKWALGFAKDTPFSSNEVVDVATRLEMRGLDAEKTLGQLGDFASAYNKSLDQAAEAFFDAQTGEWERLKEFGFKKEDLEKNFKKLGFTDIFDAKGSIKDAGKFRTAFFKMLEANYTGAMIKKSKTFGSQLETLKDNISLNMAEIFGGVEEVRAGSLFDVILKNLTSLNDWFLSADNKEMVDRWAGNIDEFVKWASGELKSFFTDISNKEIKFDWEKAKNTAKDLASAVLDISGAVVNLAASLASIDLTTLKYLSAAIVGGQIGGVYGAGIGVLAMAGFDLVNEMKKKEGAGYKEDGKNNGLGFNYKDAITDQASVAKGNNFITNNYYPEDLSLIDDLPSENEILNNMVENSPVINISNNTTNTDTTNNYSNGQPGTTSIIFTGPVTLSQEGLNISEFLKRVDDKQQTL